jgi:hypothetical protein
VNGHAGAFPRQAQRNAASNAFGRAGYQYYFVLQTKWWVLHKLWGGQFCPQPAFSRLRPPKKGLSKA